MNSFTKKHSVLFSIVLILMFLYCIIVSFSSLLSMYYSDNLISIKSLGLVLKAIVGVLYANATVFILKLKDDKLSIKGLKYIKYLFLVSFLLYFCSYNLSGISSGFYVLGISVDFVSILMLQNFIIVDVFSSYIIKNKSLN